MNAEELFGRVRRGRARRGQRPRRRIRVDEKFWAITTFCSVLFVVQVAAAQVIHVPADFISIQGAVDAALPGDTVLVAPGTYVGNIIVTKPIVVSSELGPAVTHITSTQPPQTLGVVYIAPPQLEAIFAGFTVRNCVAPAVATGGNARIVDCIIRDNAATAIICAGTTELESCVVVDNHGEDGDVLGSGGCEGLSTGKTGGIFVTASLTCINCLIARNVGGDASFVHSPCTNPPGDGEKGGILSGGSVVTLLGCSVARSRPTSAGPRISAHQDRADSCTSAMVRSCGTRSFRETSAPTMCSGASRFPASCLPTSSTPTSAATPVPAPATSTPTRSSSIR